MGYTLIEVLLVLTIMAVISSVVLANYHTAGQRGNLVMAARQLANHIRQMQNFALSGRAENCANDVCAWGVFLDQNNNFYYRMFEDLNNDELYDNNEIWNNDVLLPAGVTISGIVGLAGPNRANITFTAPDPDIEICSNAGLCGYNLVEIILSNSEGNRSVFVNKFGLVDVE